MKVLIYSNTYKLECKDYIVALLTGLLEKGTCVKVYGPFLDYWQRHFTENLKQLPTFKKFEDVETDVDFMFSLGGDGTFLESVVFVRDKNIPILGINMGRLGFLASVPQEDIPIAIEELFKMNFFIEERSLIHFEKSEMLFKNFPYALNDVTVQKKDTSMITIHTYLNDEFLNSYWADGLIISTSTGSTAYSLSVGGPIVLPSAKDFVICPIAPHNLSVRPIVIPDNNTIKLKMESRGDSFLATVDNRTEVLEIENEIVLKAADFKIKLLHLNKYSFYNTLRNKLMWGLDKRN